MSTSDWNIEFEALLDYLKLNQNCDLTDYKPSILMRRFQKRMQTVGIHSYNEYLDYLKLHPEECLYLVNTILLNVTAFFRDRGSWNYLANEIIPQIVARKQPNQPIRVWSAACASGEEAYTLAIIFAEALGTEQFLERVKIYATDVDRQAIKQAREGSYSKQNVTSIPGRLVSKYFEQTEQHYVFDKNLRRAIIFGCHNLAFDAPISRIDLLVCRNVLMYLTAIAQARILVCFHFALNDNSFLFLGNAESLSSRSNIFTPVNLKHRIFSKGLNLELQDCLLLRNRNPKKEKVKPL